MPFCAIQGEAARDEQRRAVGQRRGEHRALRQDAAAGDAERPPHQADGDELRGGEAPEHPPAASPTPRPRRPAPARSRRRSRRTGRACRSRCVLACARRSPRCITQRARDHVGDARSGQAERHRLADEGEDQQRADHLGERAEEEDRGFAAREAPAAALVQAAEIAHRVMRPPGQRDEEDELLAGDQEGQEPVGRGLQPVRPDQRRHDLRERPDELGRGGRRASGGAA